MSADVNLRKSTRRPSSPSADVSRSSPNLGISDTSTWTFFVEELCVDKLTCICNVTCEAKTSEEKLKNPQG